MKIGNIGKIGLLSPVGLLVAALALASPARAVEVQQVKSDGGISAWLVEDGTNPIISVRFAWRGGAALDPEGKAGLANLVSGLLDEGAGNLDSRAFQRTLDEYAIDLGFDAGKDNFSGTLGMLTENAATGWNLLRLALTEPRFDPEPVERIRAQILAGLRQRAEDPDALGASVLFENLFPGHPYANPADGTAESVGAIDIGDLRAFVDRYLARDNLVIGVVGDIDPATLRLALDEVFGALPEKSAPLDVEPVEPPRIGSTTVVNKAVPQSSILFAQRGPNRHDEDFFPLYVMNYILGSGFTSRLYSEIREKRGLAYSVYSYISPYDNTAIFAGGAGTANARVGETLDLVREEWQRMAERGVSAEELADAKTYLTGSYPLRFTSSGRIASMLVGLQLDGLGADYFDIRNDLIEAVTLEQVNSAARRWLDSDSLTFVIVGEPQGVEATD